jgi:hypothetical protein
VHSRRVPYVVGAAALCAWCGWVSGFHRSSRGAEITWVVSLAVVVVLAVLFRRGRRGEAFGVHIGTAAEPWPRAGRGGARTAWRGVAPWLAVIVAAAAWDALGIDTGRHEYHLTISALSQAYRPLNALLLLVWMLVGIGYAAARARAPSVAGDHDASTGNGLEMEGRGGAVLCAASLPPGGAGVHPLAPALLLPSNRAAGVVFWVGLLVVAVAVDLIARRSAGRVATAEEFARFISSAAVANLALIAAWAFAGYHLFAR